jgi:hypothetical protein
MRTATTIVYIACLISGHSAAFGQQPDFSGNWRLNTKLSQDPFEKIYTALGSDQLRAAGTASYNSINSSTFLRDTDRAATLRDLLNYAEVLEIVEIEQTERELTIAVGEGDEFFSLFYLDGEKHPRQLPEGLKIEATAAWEGEAIHIVQVGENDAVLKEIYSLVGGGQQLALIFQLESKLTEVPVQFRVVYDRVDED